MCAAFSKICIVRNAIGVGLFLRLGIAAWNGFWGPSFGAGPDAAGFHQEAVAYAGGSAPVDFQMANIYMYSLGMMYRWSVASLFLGSLLSCVAWLASAGLLSRMMTMLSIDDASQFKAMLLYALLPSAIVITSVTLREAYQLMAVNLAIYSALKIYMTRSYWHWLLLLSATALMGMLHGALMLAGICISGFTFLLVVFNPQDPRAIYKLTGILAILLLLIYFGLPLILKVFFNAHDLGLATLVQARQDSWQQSARASYSVGIKINSVLDLVLFVPIALFHYLFEPLPWKIVTALDGALFLENLLRAFLIFRIVRGLFTSSIQIRVVLVFVAYLVIETIWAVGTINWGTAVRHHIPAFGLLLLASFAFSEKDTSRNTHQS